MHDIHSNIHAKNDSNITVVNNEYKEPPKHSSFVSPQILKKGKYDELKILNSVNSVDSRHTLLNEDM